MKRTGPTNEYLRDLIIKLEKTKKPVWKRVAYELSRSTRKRVCVNVGKIEKVAPNGKTIIVPGKVLGGGNISKKMEIVAWSFTESAKKKIENVGGKAILLEKYFEKNPDGKNTVIIK